MASRFFNSLRYLPLLLAVGSSAATARDIPFHAYLQQVAQKARAQGVSERTVTSALNGLAVNPRVVALDRDNISSGGSVSGFPALAPYITRHNTQARITAGRRTYARLRSLSSEVEARYGVSAPIILAIWGHETSYGVVKGDFDLVRSLATLAWDGRRRELFEPELIDVLHMLDNGVPRSMLTGSWAGAFGNPQFLPSVYLKLAIDGDNDGIADIWNSDVDTLHSIGNYFRDAGWRRGQPWGVRAYAPNTVDRAALTTRMVSPICPRVHVRHGRWLTVAEYRAMGVIPQAPIADDAMVSLFEPDGPAAPAYLLTQNYRVILEYNCSNYYAMSVGLLADEIAR